MSGDGVLISAVITSHLRLPPAQVPALRMMRDDRDGGGDNDEFDASSCGVAANGKARDGVSGKHQHAALGYHPRALTRVVKTRAPGESQRSPSMG